jgi:hypothetical protein
MLAPVVRLRYVELEQAGALREAWVDAHHAGEEPPPDAAEAVVRTLTVHVPEPDAAAVVTGPDGRPRVALLAGRALWLLWTVGATSGLPATVRCRRIPLPSEAPIELSERIEGEQTVRHWWFEVDEEPLVFRSVDDDAAERFARALAGALGWPGPGP